jgi:hypothetical protein
MFSSEKMSGYMHAKEISEVPTNEVEAAMKASLAQRALYYSKLKEAGINPGEAINQFAAEKINLQRLYDDLLKESKA